MSIVGYLLWSTKSEEQEETPTSPSFDHILSYELNPRVQSLDFFSADSLGRPFGNHGQLQRWLTDRGQELVFAMNGGMFEKDLSPQGLYIERGELIHSIDTVKEGYGNFYLQPNGIFWIKQHGEVGVTKTAAFDLDNSFKYATQSGPMLITDGHIHPAFREGSSNLHIRNGVGVRPNGNLLFALSKERINFYDFAQFFLINGCENALYLDGFVSRVYLPNANWEQEEGSFGIIIAETK